MAVVVLRLLRHIAMIIGGLVIAVILLVTAMYLEHFLPTTLPAPSGTFRVGRTSYFFSDDAETHASNEQSDRELVVWIWYPAQVRGTAQSADYFPAPWRRAANDSWSWVMVHAITHDLSKVRVHSVLGAPVSSQMRSYPVVMMRTGSSALTLQYSALAEDLASHGYVVVGFDAPYRTQLVVLPNGEIKRRLPQNDPEEVPLPEVERLLMMWVSDARFVLDQLENLNTRDDTHLLLGRLDLNRIGVFGHSFGGAQALQVCHDDSRCKAGVDIDGMPFGSVVEAGVTRPFMFLMGDHRHDLGSEPEGLQVARDLHGIYKRMPETSRVALMIEGADHFSFADGGVVRSHVLLSILRALGLVIDGKRQLETTSACVSAFFGRYLNDQTDALSGCTQLEGVKPARLVIDGP